MNNSTIDVSVIIPVYNAQDTIENAVNSVLSNHFDGDIEIIVIDDGSTDKTAEIIKKIAEHSNTFYFCQKNQGPGAARNYGIEVSKGKYIAFLDSDDTIRSDSIQRRFDFLERHGNVSFVFSDSSVESESGEKASYGLQKQNFLEKFEGAISDHSEEIYVLNGRKYVDLAIRFYPYVSTASVVMVKKKYFSVVGTFDTNLMASEDTDLWFRLAAAGDVGYIDLPLTEYNYSQNSLTNGNARVFQHTAFFYTSLLHSPEFKKNKEDIRRRISTYWSCYGNFYHERHDWGKASKGYLKSLYYEPSLSSLKYYLYSIFPLPRSTKIKILERKNFSVKTK